MTLFDMTVGGSGSGGGGGKCFDPSKIYVGADLTLENGVVSGFNGKTKYYATNGLSISNILTGLVGFYTVFPLNTANTWEIKTKVKYTGIGTEQMQYLFTGWNPANNFYCPKIQFNTDRKMQIALSSNGTSWDIANVVVGENQLNLNEWYYIKTVFTGTEYKLQLSQDDVNYVDDIVVSSTSKIYVDNTNSRFAMGIDPRGTTAEYKYVKGYVDLTQTTVTINGEEVFRAM